jgi:hypothetical protein
VVIIQDGEVMTRQCVLILAIMALSAGDEYLGVPDPTTIGLLGLGALNLFRRKRRA